MILRKLTTQAAKTKIPAMTKIGAAKKKAIGSSSIPVNMFMPKPVVMADTKPTVKFMDSM